MSESLQRIYLDNAATSWPKPPAVIAAMQSYLRDLGAPAGRGSYQEAIEVEQVIRSARASIAQLLGTNDPRQIVFTLNGTDSLNQAIHGSLQPGIGTSRQHVVTTLAEHNSVLRPLRTLQTKGQIDVTRVPCDGAGLVDPDEIQRALRPNTAMICMTHVSNVTGAIQPAEEVGRIAAKQGIPFLLDAAQSLGHIEVDVDRLGATMLAAPGHKGLLGPLGTGILFVRSSHWESLDSTRQGGTGTDSESDQQPDSMPEKMEAGNLNVSGIVGLLAATEFLKQTGIGAIRQEERQLTDQLLAGFESLDSLTTYCPKDCDRRTGVVSASVDGLDPRDLASLLDTVHRIQVRAGFHCAPTIHEQLGTANRGGTIRFSVGPFVTSSQVDQTVAAMSELLAEMG